MPRDTDFNREAALNLLLIPLQEQRWNSGFERPVAVRLAAERVYGAMPFLTAEEQARAQEWLRIAEEDQRQYKGKITWQENPARD